MRNPDEFLKELIGLVNMYGVDSDLDTPDYIVAEFLVGVIQCLERRGHALAYKHGGEPRTKDSPSTQTPQAEAVLRELERRRKRERFAALTSEERNLWTAGCKPVVYASREDLDELREELKRPGEVRTIDCAIPDECRNTAPLRSVCAACRYGDDPCRCGMI